MAGSGRKVFSAGDVLSAADVDNYLMDQTVMKFASAAARSSVIGTAVSAGMMSYRTDGTVVEFYNGSAWTGLGTGSGDVTTAGTQTLTNKTLTSPVFVSTAVETGYYSATAFAGYTYYAGTNGAVQYLYNNATANGTVNITWAAGTTLLTALATQNSVTVTMIVVNGASPFYVSAIQVDGATPAATFWSGGTAPTAGNANSRDVYTFTVSKNSSTTFHVFASLTKFA